MIGHRAPKGPSRRTRRGPIRRLLWHMGLVVVAALLFGTLTLVPRLSSPLLVLFGWVIAPVGWAWLAWKVWVYRRVPAVLGGAIGLMVPCLLTIFGRLQSRRGSAPLPAQDLTDAVLFGLAIAVVFGSALGLLVAEGARLAGYDRMPDDSMGSMVKAAGRSRGPRIGIRALMVLVVLSALVFAVLAESDRWGEVGFLLLFFLGAPTVGSVIGWRRSELRLSGAQVGGIFGAAIQYVLVVANASLRLPFESGVNLAPSLLIAILVALLAGLWSLVYGAVVGSIVAWLLCLAGFEAETTVRSGSKADG